MNKWSVAVIIGLMSLTAWGQYDGKGAQEVSRFRAGFMWFFTGWRPAQVERVRKYDRLIFDVTYNDWTGDRGPFEQHWASIGLNTNFMFDVPLTKGNTVALGVGIAHQYTNTRHNGHLNRIDSLGATQWIEMQPDPTFRKSVLSGHAFSIPLELRFRKESWKHFKVHVGGRIGYQAQLYSKEVSEINGDRLQVKQFGFPDTGRLIYGAHLRFGFRNWALFGNYQFNPIFTDSQSSQLNALQMGISISMF